jgi:hypothetical protein
MDAQGSPWVQWDITPNIEWYIVEFSSDFSKSLSTTVRELTVFPNQSAIHIPQTTS